MHPPRSNKAPLILPTGYVYAHAGQNTVPIGTLVLHAQKARLVPNYPQAEGGNNYIYLVWYPHR